MKFGYTDYSYIGTILLGFLFGEIIICSTTVTLPSKRPFPGVYSGIFALHVQYHASKEGTDNAKQNIIFYALCVLYVFSVVFIALDIAVSLSAGFVSNCISVQLHANQLCSLTPRCAASILLNPYFSVAVTFSPKLSLYVQPIMLMHSIYPPNLQRYTVAGLCGVATSRS
jgi:hypothetical protein